MHLSARQAFARGRLIADLLSAAVRGGAAAAVPRADLAGLVPVLLRSGAGPLAWWALRSSASAGDAGVEILHQSFRNEALRAVVADQEIAELFADLSAAGLTPILGKGWCVARAYPTPGLRPYSDFDLYVVETDHARLTAAVASRLRIRTFAVDAHAGLSYLADRDADAVFARSSTIPLGRTGIRVFGAEDHLRLVCLHGLAEAMARPIWLCDIAMLVTAAPPHFDWDYFEAGAGRPREWCRAAIRLAHEVLHVDISGVPLRTRRAPLPRWLTRSVLTTWGRALLPRGARKPMDWVGRNPMKLGRALLDRWPHPLEATIGVGGAIDGLPRLPYQLAEAVRRTFGHVRRIR